MEPVSCPFCNVADNDVVLKGDLCFAIYDRFPVNKGHILIIPHRHFSDYFDATPEEKREIISLIDEAKKLIEEKYNPDGFNIGINVGKYAGQTVMHMHVHLIPRYKGDIDDPTGGVRGVIPRKRKY